MIATRPDPNAARPAELVECDFTATEPNQLWVVDFTYVPLASATAFTAFTDVYSRRIVGWPVTNSLPAELPLDALEMALWVRQRAGHTLDGLIHHSDAGSQYTAIRYSTTVTNAGGLCSIGSVGDSYDNAMAESVNGLYKTECVNLDGPFTTVEELDTPPWTGSTTTTPTDSTPRSTTSHPLNTNGTTIDNRNTRKKINPYLQPQDRNNPPLQNPGRFKVFENFPPQIA